MWRTAATVVVAAVALVGLVYLINLAAPSAIKYADSYNKDLVLEVSASNVLYADRISATLRNLKNGSLVYIVECSRHSIYGGFRYARFLCNASAVEPGIYAIEISWPLRLEGTVVVR